MKINFDKIIKLFETLILFIIIISVICILITHFLKSEKIDWTEFLEFLFLCLLLVFLIYPGISIKIPGILDMNQKLENIKDQLIHISNNITNIKIHVGDFFNLPPPVDKDKSEDTAAIKNIEGKNN